MARVKPKRQGIHIDMTAMSDMAWLLLTFFILTTQFKPKEVITIDPPTSISEEKIQEKKQILISIAPDGRYFFSVDESLRNEVLHNIAEKHDMKFTDKQIGEFKKISAIGVPLNELGGYLNLTEMQRETMKVAGIPGDSINPEIIEWVMAARELELTNDSLKLDIAIKGDVGTKYPRVKNLFNRLKDQDESIFQLVTNSESKEGK